MSLSVCQARILVEFADCPQFGLKTVFCSQDLTCGLFLSFIFWARRFLAPCRLPDVQLDADGVAANVPTHSSSNNTKGKYSPKPKPRTHSTDVLACEHTAISKQYFVAARQRILFLEKNHLAETVVGRNQALEERTITSQSEYSYRTDRDEEKCDCSHEACWSSRGFLPCVAHQTTATTTHSMEATKM